MISQSLAEQDDLVLAVAVAVAKAIDLRLLLNLLFSKRKMWKISLS